MFRWFKKPSSSTPDLEAIVHALGALMDKYPTQVLDTSMLPLPKTEMKAAIKEAWLASDLPTRKILEAGYVFLAQFQDGVGDRPIDSAIRPGMSPREVLAVLKPAQEWNKRCASEGDILLAEVRAFPGYK